MFVMVSPLQAHLSETLTSLKFATKVRFYHVQIEIPITDQICRCITLTLEPQRGKRRSRIRDHKCCYFFFVLVVMIRKQTHLDGLFEAFLFFFFFFGE
jgi:hypothetical protein